MCLTVTLPSADSGSSILKSLCKGLKRETNIVDDVWQMTMLDDL